jgi:outer membrane immunogenic protein
MKNIVVAGLALVAFAAAGPVMAADMPLKAPVAPPVVDPWSGLYIGGNAGYSWGNWDNNAPSGNFLVNGVFSTFASPDVKGWVAGGQIGFNQLCGRWLYGVEVDGQATGQHADLNGTTTINLGGGTTVTSTLLNHWDMPWFATLRGRVGAVVADTWLFYVTGGVAVGHFNYSVTSTATVTTRVAGTVTATVFNEEGVTRAGGVVGVGVEKAIDAHWRVKAEYLYMDFGSRTFIAGSGFDNNIRLRDNIARVGFNYRFLP